MAGITPKDWLDWHSARAAQDCAVRLSLACSAVVPSDKNFQNLIDEQIISDLIAFAIHGRRAMERRGDKSASLGDDPLWPASHVPKPQNTNLFGAFSAVVHAESIEVEWEEVDLDPNPYNGRVPRFAGSVRVKSDKKELNIPLGSLVASFFGNFLNQQPA